METISTVPTGRGRLLGESIGALVFSLLLTRTSFRQNSRVIGDLRHM